MATKVDVQGTTQSCRPSTPIKRRRFRRRPDRHCDARRDSGPIHFEYAVKQGKNIFAEKPGGDRAQGIRQVFLAAVKEAKEKTSRSASGLQAPSSGQLHRNRQGIQDGELAIFAFSASIGTMPACWVSPAPRLSDRNGIPDAPTGIYFCVGCAAITSSSSTFTPGRGQTGS